MKIGGRIRERLTATGISQAELARRVGMSQPAINSLIRGSSRSSTHLHRIARELATTPAYLEGETDDPDENAPAPAAPLPSIQYVMMPVALPSEPALARMFEVLLDGIDPAAPQAERAQLLAQRLPIGLSQLQGLQPVRVKSAGRRAAPADGDAARAMPDREPIR